MKKNSRHNANWHRWNNENGLTRLLARRVLVDGKPWSKTELARELRETWHTVNKRLKTLEAAGKPITLANLKDPALWGAPRRKPLPFKITVPQSRPLSPDCFD